MCIKLYTTLSFYSPPSCSSCSSSLVGSLVSAFASLLQLISLLFTCCWLETPQASCSITTALQLSGCNILMFPVGVSVCVGSDGRQLHSLEVVPTMDPGRRSGGRGSNHQTGQNPGPSVLLTGLLSIEHEIEKIKHECERNQRLHREEVERLHAQFREEMEEIKRKYGRLMAEKEAEYRHEIGNLENNRNKVMLNRQLREMWKGQPDPRALRQLLRTVPTAYADSQRQTSCLHPNQTMLPPPPCLSSASSYLWKLAEIAQQRQATAPAFYNSTDMMQEHTDPQPVAQDVDMMPNYWLTTEAFLTSNFDQSWWWQRRQ